jgi:hypothetical protein
MGDAARHHRCDQIAAIGTVMRPGNIRREREHIHKQRRHCYYSGNGNLSPTF